jgi:hypothetical protein
MIAHDSASRQWVPHGQVLRGRSAKAFGFVPWFVFGTGVFTLLFLAGYPEATIPTLEVLFPAWAVLLLLLVKDNLAAPILGFPIVYLIWIWLGSITILPPTNLPTTLLDPIPAGQWLIYLLGFVSYMAAVLVLGRPRQSPTVMQGYRPRWDQRRFLLLLGIATAITAFAWLVITVQEGIPFLNADVEEFRVSMPARYHVLFQIEVAGASYILPLLFAYRWSMRPRKLVGAALWGLTILNAFILISQGNRGLILPPLLTILILRHFLIKPWRVLQIVPTSIVVAILMGISGYYRSLRHFGDSFITTQIQLGLPSFIQPFAGFYFSVRTPLTTFRDVMVMIPKIVPYQYGRLTFGCVLQLLPGRHPSSDYFFKDILGHDFAGFGEPASLLGTFYGDFGLPAILVGMIGVGAMASLLYGTMLKEQRLHWLIVYAYILQKLLSGIYGSLFEYIVEILLPLVWFLTLKYFAQSEVSAATNLAGSHSRFIEFE